MCVCMWGISSDKSESTILGPAFLLESNQACKYLVWEQSRVTLTTEGTGCLMASYGFAGWQWQLSVPIAATQSKPPLGCPGCWAG